jgi:hypothetical protein
MRLPFVSRSAHDDMLGHRERTIAFLEKQLHNEQERTRYLTDLVADMKVSGASVVRQIVRGSEGSSAKLAPRPRSSIEQAIDENRYASSNPRLRAHLAAWGEREIARGVEEKTVLDRLRSWSQPSNDDDDDDDEDDTVLGV